MAMCTCLCDVDLDFFFFFREIVLVEDNGGEKGACIYAIITGGVAMARSPATKFKKPRPTFVPDDCDIIIAIIIIIIIGPPPSYSSSVSSLNDLAPPSAPPSATASKKKSKMAPTDARPSLRLPACLPAN